MVIIDSDPVQHLTRSSSPRLSCRILACFAFSMLLQHRVLGSLSTREPNIRKSRPSGLSIVRKGVWAPWIHSHTICFFWRHAASRDTFHSFNFAVSPTFASPQCIEGEQGRERKLEQISLREIGISGLVGARSSSCRRSFPAFPSSLAIQPTAYRARHT